MRLADQRGFTLVELLVTMTLLTVIVGATLTVLEVFQRQAQANTRRGDAQDVARNAMDQVATSLRSSVTTSSGAAIEWAQPDDLVFERVDAGSSPAGQNAADLMRVRYCVDAGNPSNEKLLRFTQHWSTSAPPALGTLPTCTSASAGTGGWDTSVRSVADHLVNTISAGHAQVFSYLPASSPLASITRVGVTLTASSDPSQQPPPTQLSSVVALRNLNRPPTVALSCSAVGGGRVMCDSWGTSDPDGQALSYAWSYGTSCAALSTISGATAAKLTKTGLTPGTQYCFGLTASDPAGVSATTTRTVTAT